MITSHCRLGFPEESDCRAGDTGDSSSSPGLGRSPGEGNGNPLQYSCQENPMDRGAWRAAVHGVVKSQTRLKPLSMRALCTGACTHARAHTHTHTHTRPHRKSHLYQQQLTVTPHNPQGAHILTGLCIHRFPSPAPSFACRQLFRHKYPNLLVMPASLLGLG